MTTVERTARIGRFTKVYNVNNHRREVTLEPPLFGPYEVDQPTDKEAVQHVLRKWVRPYIEMGAITEPVSVVCGKVREPA